MGPDAPPLRLATAGSVDDGKSTLIGRLLHDGGRLDDDQLAALRREAQRRGGGELDLSLVTDGLEDERAQGITIDVAYRHLTTGKRRFLIADVPGHEQYTRNMVTGASTADAALIVVDARKGPTKQSLCHAGLAVLLGLPQLVVAVNKMDLVGFAEAAFREVAATMRAAIGDASGVALRFVPVSALAGDNVVQPSRRMAWYAGPPLLAVLESATPADRADGPLRLPVQQVLRVARPEGVLRLHAGRIASGALRLGDALLALPSGRRTRVAAIRIGERPLRAARAPASVAVALTDEIDAGRGEVLVDPGAPPAVASRLEATLCWLDEVPLVKARLYELRHGTRAVRARIEALSALADDGSSEATLAQNGIARARLRLAGPIVAAPYRMERPLGGFVLVDAQSGATAAAGMILTLEPG